MAATQQDSPALHPAEVAELGVPAFFVSSFNLSATSNEVVLVGTSCSRRGAAKGRRNRRCCARAS